MGGRIADILESGFKLWPFMYELSNFCSSTPNVPKATQVIFEADFGIFWPNNILISVGMPKSSTFQAFFFQGFFFF